MKITIDNLRPGEDHLKRINQLANGQLEAGDVAVLPVLVIDGTPTVYDTVPDESWFKAALNDLNGDEGVSMQRNHNIHELPSGRFFAGSLEQKDGMAVLSALAYTDNEDLIDDYLKGIVKAVSAGLSYDWLKCSVCGNVWWSDECKAAAKKAKHTVSWAEGYFGHWPGDAYGDIVCRLVYMMNKDRGALREVSPVYKGASEGKLLGIDKIAEFKANLHQELSAQLAAGDGLFETAIDAVAKKYQTKLGQMVLEVPAIDNDDTGIDDETKPETISLAAHETAVEELTAILESAEEDKAALKAEKGELETKLAMAEKEHKTLASANDDLQKRLDAMSAEMTRLAESLGCMGAEFGAVVDTALGLATLAKTLRVAMVGRIEKLGVQLHGNDAEQTSEYETTCDGECLVRKLETLEQEFGAKFTATPVTQVEDNREPAERKRGVPDAVFNTSE